MRQRTRNSESITRDTAPRSNRPESMQAVINRLYEENYRPTLQDAYSIEEERRVTDSIYPGKDGFMHVASDYDSEAYGEPRDASDIDSEQHSELAGEAEEVEDLHWRVEQLSRRKIQLFRDSHVQSLFAEAFQIGGYTARKAANDWLDTLGEHSFKRGTLRYALEHTPTGRTIRGQPEYVQRTREDVETFLRAYVG